MDDPGQVQAVVSFLAPYLPYLVAGATEVAKGAAKKVGEIGTESAWKKAQALWARIRRRRDPDLDTKVQVVTLDPTEEAYLAVLARYLVRFLEAQPELAAELSALLEGDPDVQEVIARNKGIVERVVQIGPGTKRVEADTGGRIGSVWQES
jgi:hypothetical protein